MGRFSSTSLGRRRTPSPARLLGVCVGVGFAADSIFFLARAAATRHPITGPWAWLELSTQVATYAYLATSTAVVALVAGLVLGRTISYLKVASNTDPLTQLPNRRALEERMAQEAARSTESGLPFCLMVVDVDRLKTINDRDGHTAGDRALRTVASVLTRACRSRDMVARWGGDEFVVVMARTRAPEAMSVADRVQKVLASPDEDGRGAPRVTVSIGIAEQVGGRPALAATLFDAADRALMNAKRKGGQRASIGPLESGTMWTRPPAQPGPASVRRLKTIPRPSMRIK